MIRTPRASGGMLVVLYPEMPHNNCAFRKVFITNSDGSEYVGQVWPGYTVGRVDHRVEVTADLCARCSLTGSRKRRKTGGLPPSRTGLKPE